MDMNVTTEVTMQLKVYKEDNHTLILSVYGYDEKLFAWVKRMIAEYVERERQDLEKTI